MYREQRLNNRIRNIWIQIDIFRHTTRLWLWDDYGWASSTTTPKGNETNSSLLCIRKFVLLHNPPSTLLPSVRSFPACVAKRLGATFKPLQKDENREISNTNQISFLGGLEYIILFSPLDRIPIFANRHLHRLCLVSLKPITETQSLYGKMQTFFCAKSWYSISNAPSLLH